MNITALRAFRLVYVNRIDRRRACDDVREYQRAMRVPRHLALWVVLASAQISRGGAI